MTKYLRVNVLLCATALTGVYLCASGLLRLDEVFARSKSPAATAASLESSSTASNPASSVSDNDDSSSSITSPQYDRLVVVLIDALRADMVLGSDAMYGHTSAPHERVDELSAHMPFTRSLVESGAALGYIAHASIPTVTMPRLKALVTGKAPAFIDILKNFNSAAVVDENVVTSLAASGRRLVFYGDDTWLALFPTAFVRTDGTSGFYTRDTVEVDVNVTRHLATELDPAMAHPHSRDWDVLVLHYLGLDHVGHLRGPRSSLMVDKLAEMDAVVARVYESVVAQDALRKAANASARASLLLLCSDHGMSEGGNHGGATVEESSALLLFARGDQRAMATKTAMVPTRRLQVDLVPTLATLFGLQIPPHSTGRVLEDVVRASGRMDETDETDDGDALLLQSLVRNYKQLRQLAASRLPPTKLMDNDAQVAATLERVAQSADAAASALDFNDVDALQHACMTLQRLLAQSDGSEYNANAVALGLLCLFASAAVAIQRSCDTSTLLTVRSLAHDPVVTVVLLAGSILQIVSLTSSSSIENEHATVFYLLTTALVAIGVQFVIQLSPRLSRNRASRTQPALLLLGVALVCTRILRSRNQVINFGRLNHISSDPHGNGNAFATDDSLSILSTAPLFADTVAPERWIVLIGAVGSAKALAALHRRPVKSLQRVVLVLATAAFALGMLCNLRCAISVETAAAATAAPADAAWSADDYARAVYALVALLLVLLVVAQPPTRLVVVEMATWLLVTLLQRESNVPTLGVLCIQLASVDALLRVRRTDGRTLALLGLWLAQSAFFALGNSHLVTTIDISQSFRGLSYYSQTIVGFLTFVSVFAGPLVVFVHVLQWVYAADDESATTAMDADKLPSAMSTSSSTTAIDASLTVFVYQTLRFAIYTIVVYLMRFHLFIWSVFAPKMLYEVAQTSVALVLTLALASLRASSSTHHQ